MADAADAGAGLVPGGEENAHDVDGLAAAAPREKTPPDEGAGGSETPDGAIDDGLPTTAAAHDATDASEGGTAVPMGGGESTSAAAKASPAVGGAEAGAAGGTAGGDVGEVEGSTASRSAVAVEVPTLIDVPKHHELRRRQSFAGHGLYHAYTLNWGPIISAVMGFSTKPNVAAIEDIIRTRLVEYPRFVSRVSADGKYWERCERIDFSHHFREVTLPGDDAKSELEGFVSDHLAVPFDPERPQWESILLSYENEPARFDLLWRINHCIGDGITLATLLIDLCEPLGDAPERRVRAPKPVQPAVVAAVVLLALCAIAAPVVFCLGTGPMAGDWFDAEPLDEGIRVVIVIVWVLFVICVVPPLRIWCLAYLKVSSLPVSSADTTTIIKGGKSRRSKGYMSERKLFVSTEDTPIDVQRCKKVAKFVDPKATVNDVLMAALGGGLRRFLEESDDPAVADEQDIKLRAISIVNMRALKGLQADSKKMLEDVKAARWGNDFSYYLLPLPSNPVEAPLDRIAAMHANMKFIKRSPEGFLIREGNRTIYNCCGVSALMKFNQHNLDKLECFMSNMPGPQFPLSFAGAKIDRLFNCTHPLEFGSGYSFLSYNGKIILCVSADANTVPNPHRIAECVMQEYRNYEEAAGLTPEEGAVDLVAVEMGAEEGKQEE